MMNNNMIIVYTISSYIEGYCNVDNDKKRPASLYLCEMYPTHIL